MWASLPHGASPHGGPSASAPCGAFPATCTPSTPPWKSPTVWPRRDLSGDPVSVSPAEISLLLGAAAELGPPLRAAPLGLIGLLWVSGLRIGEAIALDDDDLDTQDDLLVVRDSKFDKSRLVPLHPSTAQALERYVDLRTRTCPGPTSPALFVSSRGTRLHHSNISLTFATLLQQVGITRRSASCRPRIHDLRHSFATTTVLNCYRDGGDVAAMLPRLATYLGHSDPKHTFWYLSAAPELMAIAGERLDVYVESRA